MIITRSFAFATLFASSFALAAMNARAQTSSTAPPAAPQINGRIRGVAFDSLLMRPVARASITLLDGTQTTTTDDRGQFAFDNITPGKHLVAFSTPELDSLGFGTLGGEIGVLPGETARITVATQSLATLWKLHCTRTPNFSGDSGIVWGSIRNANSDSTLAGATAAFSWYELKPGTIPGIRLNEVRKQAIADNDGRYFACGLPTDVAIASEGATVTAASGTVQYSIGARHLYRMDLLLSTDMVVAENIKPGTRADSIAMSRARGSAVLKGSVVDIHDKPLANAVVSVASADTSVRTDKLGEFVVAGLPAGTQLVQVRQIGFAPATRFVDLHSNQTATLKLEVSDAKALDVFNVRGTAIKGGDRKEYEDRKKSGMGYFLEPEALARRSDVGSALKLFPGVNVDYKAGGITVTMPGTFKGRCTPSAFLDGLPTDYDIIALRHPEDFRAIEAYTNGGAVPGQYKTMNGCGTILFWSKNARW